MSRADALASLVDALSRSARPPATVTTGPLTSPTVVRVHSPEAAATPASGAAADERGIALVTWRSTLYVLAHDARGAAGCVTCLRNHVLLQNVPRHAPTGAAAWTAAPTDAADGWSALGPTVRDLATRLGVELSAPGVAPGTLAVLDTITLATRRGMVAPDDDCAVCGPVRPGAPGAAPTDPALLRKAPGTLHSAHPLPADLADVFLGSHTLFKGPMIDLDGPVPAVQIGVPLWDGQVEPGVGRTRTVDRSTRTAVLEGLERYAGLHPRGGETVLASLDDLGGRAVDPGLLGYHDPGAYAAPDFPYAPLSPHEQVAWLPVTCPGRAGERLLPASAITWAGRSTAGRPLFYDTSNGFALGQSLEEAALHGLLEVIERDAFLLTWYRRLRLPEIVLGAADRPLVDLLARIRFMTGFGIQLFSATLDTGVPVIIALARRSATSGPCTFVSAGAGLDPRAAAESAVFEVAAIMAAVTHAFDDTLDRATRLEADHTAVRTMEDHSLLGSLPSATPWYDFLTHPDRPTVGLDEIGADIPRHARLDDDLDHVVSRLERVGSMPLVADLTPAELGWRGLVCARAFATGLLPMTFGNRHRRVAGLPRLTATGLPYPDQLADGQAPGDVPPHPFP